MKNFLVLFSALGLIGCVSNMYDVEKHKAGKTVMDGKMCQDGVCKQDPMAPIPEVLPPLLQTTEHAVRAQ
jgi:hypothetical protein